MRTGLPLKNIDINYLYERLTSLESLFFSHRHDYPGSGTQSAEIVDGYLKSANFVSGKSGWQISGNGDVEFNSGVFRGSLSAVSGTLKTITVSDVIQTAPSGARISLYGSDNLSNPSQIQAVNADNNLVFEVQTSKTILQVMPKTDDTAIILFSSGVAATQDLFWSSLSNASSTANTIYTENAGSGAALRAVNSGTGYAIRAYASSSATGIHVENVGSGIGIDYSQSGTPKALNIVNSYTGTTACDPLVYLEQDGIGKAIELHLTNANGGDTAIDVHQDALGGAGLIVDLSQSSNPNSAAEFSENYSGDGGHSVSISQNNSSAGTSRTALYIYMAGAGKYINTYAGAYCSNGGTWTDASSRKYKHKFTKPIGVLDKIEQLDVWQYEYKKEKDVKRISPVSEDLYKLFKVGDDKSIAPKDLAGIALAGIKELLIRIKKLEYGIHTK